MIGLLAISVAIVWLAIALFLAVLMPKRFFNKTWWPLITIMLLVVLIPLPLIDEIIGGVQFKRLCEEHSAIRMNPASAAGRTVYLADLPDVEIKGTWVPVVLTPWQFVDATTREPVVSYDTLHAAGGWLIHAFPLYEGEVPLTFSGFCAPANRPASADAFKRLGINYIEPPANKRPMK
jgi:hypothetical protein